MMKCYLPDGADIDYFVTETIQRLPSVKDAFTTITFEGFG
jgi:DNA-binding Lrp family transcriptional regulator